MTRLWGISHLTQHQSQKLGPQTSDAWQACSWDHPPVEFRPKPDFWVEIFKNQDPTCFYMGNWGIEFWGLHDHRKFRSGNVQDKRQPWDQATHLEFVFQRAFMCYMVSNIFYYWYCHLPIRQTFLFKFCIYIPFIGEISTDNAVSVSTQNVYNLIGIFTNCT